MTDHLQQGAPLPSQVPTLELTPVDARAPWEDEQPIGHSPRAMRARYAPAEAALRGRRATTWLQYLLLALGGAVAVAWYPAVRGQPPLFSLPVALVLMAAAFGYSAVIEHAVRAVHPRFPLILFGGWAAGLVVGFALFLVTRTPWATLILLGMNTQTHLSLAWLAYSPGGRVLFSPAYQAAIAATPDFALPAPRQRPRAQARQEERGRFLVIASITLAAGLLALLPIGWWVFTARH